jgi:hypothetical protein
LVSGASCPVARLIVPLYFGTARPDPLLAKEECWLDTGVPLSVVPFHVHHGRLFWQVIPGIQTTWAGQPCRLGRTDLWLPTTQPPYLRGPLTSLARFPLSDPPGDPASVLLGLEFSLAHQAEFQLLLPARDSVIWLP